MFHQRNPAHRGQFHELDGIPGPFGGNECGLVEHVHRLGQGTVKATLTVPTEALTPAAIRASE